MEMGMSRITIWLSCKIEDFGAFRWILIKPSLTKKKQPKLYSTLAPPIPKQLYSLSPKFRMQFET